MKLADMINFLSQYLKKHFQDSKYYLVAASGWGSRLISGFAQIISISIVLSYLGSDLYAVFAVVIGLQSWFALADLGIGSSLQNYISEARVNNQSTNQLLSNASLIIFALLTLFSVLFILISPLLQYALFHKIAANLAFSQFYILATSGVLQIITALLSISYRVFFAEQRGYLSYLYQAIGPIFSVLAIWLIKYINVSSDSRLFLILLCWIVPQLIITATGFIHTFPVKGIFRNFNSQIVKQLMKRGIKFSGFALFAALTLALDYVVMTQTLNTKEIVIYNILFKGFSFIYFIYSAVLTAVWPEMAEMFLKKEWQKATKTLYKNIILGIAFIIICTLLFIFARHFIITILAPKQSILLPFAAICFFGIYYIIRIWTDTFATALRSYNYLKVFLFVIPFQALLSISGMLYFSKHYGLNGIIFGLSLSFLLTVAWILPLCYYKTRKINPR